MQYQCLPPAQRVTHWEHMTIYLQHQLAFPASCEMSQYHEFHLRDEDTKVKAGYRRWQ